jgi:hypothetical protein
MKTIFGILHVRENVLDFYDKLANNTKVPKSHMSKETKK